MQVSYFIDMERADYPWSYRAADRASASAQKRHFFALRSQLAIFFTVGLFSAIPGWVQLTDGGNKGFAVASAIFLIAGLVVVGAVREQKFDKVWFDARAIAESSKTLCWRYMMRVPPFQFGKDSVDQLLIDELHIISSSRQGALQDMTGTETNKSQISEQMRLVRQSPFDERKAYYLAARVAEERDWYHDKSAENREKSNWWYWAVIGTQLIAIVAAVLRGAGFTQVSLVGPLMTLAASFSAWTQARRHDELRTSYSVAADELTGLEAKVELCTSETDLIARRAQRSLLSSIYSRSSIKTRGLSGRI